ncbi:MobA/MobL family protein [Roseibium sp. AS2]|uniref:MobA/MobL family protein n=1 Tax=Roseibium sp. AS2 TaxID=3135781 RepID=UPI00317EC278
MDDQFHCHVDNLSRRKRDGGERSAVAAAAYISGTALWNEREQKITNFGNRRDVVHSEILVPSGAPAWTKDREQLWNAVDASAKRIDARLAKTIVSALSRDIPRDQWIKVAQEFAAPFVANGMVADIAIHDDGTGHNPHVHVILTIRSLKPNGFGSKIPNVDHKGFVDAARRGWETTSNKYLAAAGSSVRLDRRSYKTRGIPKVPTQHRGPDQAERRLKREAARAYHQSQGEIMAKEPDIGEPLHEPNLDEAAVRPDEHAVHSAEQNNQEAYRKRQVHRANEEARLAARAGDRYDAAARESATASERPWYEEARLRARREAGLDRDEAEPSERSFEQELADRHAEYEQSVLQRATALSPTAEERELMAIAENASPEIKAHIDTIVMEERMRRIRDEDDAERLARFEQQLDPSLRDQLSAYAAERRERSRASTSPEQDHDEEEHGH